MASMYYDDDADLTLLHGKRIAIIGYGNQGHAHAQNLRDSGCNVRVGVRQGGASWRLAGEDGFTVQTVAEAAAWADVISILLPDQFHREVFEESIREHLTPDKLLLTAHGFSIHFGAIEPPPEVDVAMVAPVGPGHMMRRLYRSGLGEPALIAVHRDVSGSAWKLALAYAAALGCTRAGVVRTSFREETEANLFGEQAVLCGGLSALIRAGFDKLVEAGYQEEVAYFECVHTVKLIVDLIYEGGLAFMHSRISDTAEYGSYVSGSRVIDEHVDRSMDQVLDDIQDGAFARRWIADYTTGAPELKAMRREREKQRIDVVGARLRAMMSWLGRSEAAVAAENESPSKQHGVQDRPEPAAIERT